MWGVVNEGGTGSSARVAGLDIAGKTGTAQVVSVSLKESGHTSEFRNNAWFVGYAPSAHPEIVVAALVMHGEHSTVAAPVARDVIKAYFDKKLPLAATPEPLSSQARVAPTCIPRPGNDFQFLAPEAVFARRQDDVENDSIP